MFKKIILVLAKERERRKLADLHRKAEYIKKIFLKEGYDVTDPLQRYSS